MGAHTFLSSSLIPQVALGGPVGAIIGGVVANATTGATLGLLDKKVWHKAKGVPATEDPT